MYLETLAGNRLL